MTSADQPPAVLAAPEENAASHHHHHAHHHHHHHHRQHHDDSAPPPSPSSRWSEVHSTPQRLLYDDSSDYDSVKSVASLLNSASLASLQPAQSTTVANKLSVQKTASIAPANNSFGGDLGEQQQFGVSKRLGNKRSLHHVMAHAHQQPAQDFITHIREQMDHDIAAKSSQSTMRQPQSEFNHYDDEVLRLQHVDSQHDSLDFLQSFSSHHQMNKDDDAAETQQQQQQQYGTSAASETSDLFDESKGLVVHRKVSFASVNSSAAAAPATKPAASHDSFLATATTAVKNLITHATGHHPAAQQQQQQQHHNIERIDEGEEPATSTRQKSDNDNESETVSTTSYNAPLINNNSKAKETEKAESDTDSESEDEDDEEDDKENRRGVEEVDAVNLGAFYSCFPFLLDNKGAQARAPRIAASLGSFNAAAAAAAASTVANSRKAVVEEADRVTNETDD